MAAIFHGSIPIYSFGFHGACLDDADAEHSVPHNIKLALSWIPIIGAIIGAIRFVKAYQEYQEEVQRYSPEKDSLSYQKTEMVRGGTEALTLGCAGPILMILDLIVSIGRMCTEEPLSDW